MTYREYQIAAAFGMRSASIDTILIGNWFR